MRWFTLSRSLRPALVVAAAGVVAITWGGASGAGLAAPDGKPATIGLAGESACASFLTCGLMPWPDGCAGGTCVGTIPCIATSRGYCECAYYLSTGGVAELPSVAGASAAETVAGGGGAGWSAGNAAALAGGVAAAVAALAAGAWYARRRWLR